MAHYATRSSVDSARRAWALRVLRIGGVIQACFAAFWLVRGSLAIGGLGGTALAAALLAAVLAAQVLFSGPHQRLIMTTAAFFAVLGHLFPVWLKFRGGKGVATSLGAFILLTPKSILCMVFLFLVIAVAFRYVSLGSIAVAAAFPLLAWALHEYVDPRQLGWIALVSALVIWRHRQNIGRLAAGTESKLGKEAGSESKSESKSKLEKSGTLGATRR